MSFHLLHLPSDVIFECMTHLDAVSFCALRKCHSHFNSIGRERFKTFYLKFPTSIFMKTTYLDMGIYRVSGEQMWPIYLEGEVDLEKGGAWIEPVRVSARLRKNGVYGLRHQEWDFSLLDLWGQMKSPSSFCLYGNLDGWTINPIYIKIKDGEIMEIFHTDPLDLEPDHATRPA